MLNAAPPHTGCSDQNKNWLREYIHVGEYLKIKMKSVSLFRGHKMCVTTQYEELYRLKDASVRLQTRSSRHTGSLTLHPVVVSFMENGSLRHHSLCYISPCVSHNTMMITTIIKTMLSRDIKSILDKQHFDTIHYLSDSPSSQYPNGFSFFLTLAHLEISGLHARWDYFEAAMASDPMMESEGSWRA